MNYKVVLNGLYYVITLVALALGFWMLWVFTSILLSWYWVLVILLAPIAAVTLLVVAVLIHGVFFKEKFSKLDQQWNKNFSAKI